MSKADFFALMLMALAVWIFATKDNPVERVNGAIYLVGGLILFYCAKEPPQ